jgi:hypothetical protein
MHHEGDIMARERIENASGCQLPQLRQDTRMLIVIECTPCGCSYDLFCPKFVFLG